MTVKSRGDEEEEQEQEQEEQEEGGMAERGD
jgi:hypothetical protein